MALATGAHMQLMDYEPQDDGVTLHFVSDNPGSGNDSDYYLTLTDAEVRSIVTQDDYDLVVTNALMRKLRCNTISCHLDAYLSRTLTI